MDQSRTNNGRSARQAERLDVISIPTGDPEAALRFCRQLAQMISEAPPSPAPGLFDLPAPRETPSDHPTERPALSVVIPVHDEAGNIPMLIDRLTAVLKAQGLPYELVFVDDGSRDESLAVLLERAAADQHLVIVELARNFGHQVAISAGLDFARGDGVIVMDGDLQDPPEVLPEFIAKWREGYDVVYAVRQGRKESWPMRAAYAGFYRLLRRAANVDIPLDAGDFCLMDRQVVDLLCAMPERNRFVRGIRSWVGLHQVGLPYQRQARYAGHSNYSMSRLTILALDGLVSFSFLPLRIATLLGFAISALSLLLAALYTVKKLTVGLSPPGFATLIVAILFLAGIQLITIGVIGEYVGRIFDEVKQRPLYVVRRVTGGPA